ncbi:MAG: hypothetical protein K2M90_02690, partial [Treponemataceae bacterium]|nr:hypothetical protein [Treponemataceae bacterium]
SLACHALTAGKKTANFAKPLDKTRFFFGGGVKCSWLWRNAGLAGVARTERSASARADGKGAKDEKNAFVVGRHGVPGNVCFLQR